MAKASSLKNMVVALLVITFVAAATLGAVYVFTGKPIEAARLAKINKAIAEVTPPFDNNPSDEVREVPVDGRTLRLFPAKKDGALVGIAVETATTKGFSGLITLMVGFLPDGTIYNTAVISHAETPGLGDKIDRSKSNFSVQFEGKHPDNFQLAVKKDGGDVDAITASTISSRAFCDAVERAYKAISSGQWQ
ncbi:MAG: RnfABCDGE type electron transport complex subunit G [Prevotellaceae bacterium]|jgi:electron transport complex protein RnfG|nr:RnfABCDGE type electron transport complex subunit G [Prevotellaceae bacterium]